jgi:LysR family hydrogen peroxide-inducible transcriptional activator
MPTLLPMFLKTFVKKYPKIKLKIEELTTQEIIQRISKGHLDAAIAATPLQNETIKERVLFFEPFVAYIPKGHKLHTKQKIKTEDLVLDDMLLLEDGHCLRDGIINLCKTNTHLNDKFQLQSGSIETLIKLSNEGLGMTLLPHLHTQDLNAQDKENLHYFEAPSPAREVSLIYHKSELKMQIIEAMQSVISGIIRGAIKFQDVQIISPLAK